MYEHCFVLAVTFLHREPGQQRTDSTSHPDFAVDRAQLASHRRLKR